MDNFGEWIQKQLEAKGWRQADLAVAAELDTAVISNLINGKRGPGVDTCKAIAKALKLPIENVYQAAGLLPPRSEHDDIIAEILYDLGGFPITDKEEIREYVRMKRNIAEKRGDYKAGE